MSHSPTAQLAHGTGSGRRTMPTTRSPRSRSPPAGASRTRPSDSCPSTSRSWPGAAAPNLPSMISRSVPHTPSASASTSTGPSEADGSPTSLSSAEPSLPGRTVIARMAPSLVLGHGPWLSVRRQAGAQTPAPDGRRHLTTQPRPEGPGASPPAPGPSGYLRGLAAAAADPVRDRGRQGRPAAAVVEHGPAVAQRLGQHHQALGRGRAGLVDAPHVLDGDVAVARGDREQGGYRQVAGRRQGVEVVPAQLAGQVDHGVDRRADRGGRVEYHDAAEGRADQGDLAGAVAARPRDRRGTRRAPRRAGLVAAARAGGLAVAALVEQDGAQVVGARQPVGVGPEPAQ